MVLSRHTLLAISIAAMFSPPAVSGEIGTSGSLETYLYHTDVNSSLSTLNKNDIASVSDVTLNADYGSKLFTSSLNTVMTNIDNDGSSQSSDTYVDYNWQNQLVSLKKSLSIHANFSQRHPILSEFKTGIQDRVYSASTGAVQQNQDYEARYTLPRAFPLDGYMSHQYSSAQLKWDDNRVAKANIDVATSTARVGQYSRKKGLYWAVSGSKKSDGKSVGSDIISTYGNAITRLPVFSNWFAVGSGSYSNYESESNVQLKTLDETRSKFAGFGVAWVGDHNAYYIQVTRELDLVRDENYIGFDIKLPISQRLSLNAKLSRKFYGDSKDFGLFYDGEVHNFSVTHDSAVDLRYQLSVENVVEGIYVCNQIASTDQGSSIDDNSCFRPAQLNYQLQPNQSLITRFETLYPLVERLTNQESSSFVWAMDRDSWSHSLTLSKAKTLDLEKGFTQQKKSLYFTGEKKLNTTSHLSFSYDYSDMSFEVIEDNNTQNVIIGYHRELNSRAKWGISLQYINREFGEGRFGFSEDNFDYTDRRVFLSYTHHFGVDNPKLRPLY